MTSIDRSFCRFAPTHGRLAAFGDPFPADVQAWRGASLAFRGGTTCGFVHEGKARLTTGGGEFLLEPGMYFSVPGAGEISGSGCGMAVTQPGYAGFFQIGGPAEESGRLRYIDGCTDSLLIAPVPLSLIGSTVPNSALCVNAWTTIPCSAPAPCCSC